MSISVYTNESIAQAKLCREEIFFNNFKLSTFTFKWNIHKFIDSRYQFESSSIQAKNDGFNLIWKLFYCFKYNKTSELVGFDLKTCDLRTYETEIRVRFMLTSKGGSTNKITVLVNDTLGMNNPVNHHYAKEVHAQFASPHSNEIAVELEIEVAEKVNNNVIYHKLTDDFERLLTDESLSDITLVVGDKEFKAHKLVLGARSPLFARMLSNEMPEGTTNKVEIQDIEPDTFQELLKFIYSGKISFIDIEKMGALLIAGDRYGVSDLRPFCEENIIKNISVDTAANVFMLADLIKSEDLKEKAMKFIFAQKNQVINTDSYRKMTESHLHLVQEMFCKAEIK